MSMFWKRGWTHATCHDAEAFRITSKMGDGAYERGDEVANGNEGHLLEVGAKAIAGHAKPARNQQ